MNFIIFLLPFLLSSCGSVNTQYIKENGRDILVMKAERFISRHNPLWSTSIGLHFESERNGSLKGYVEVACPIHDIYRCSVGDMIFFSLEKDGKKYDLAYSFTEIVNKRGVNFFEANWGFGMSSNINYLVFSLSKDDLEKIANANKLSMALTSMCDGRIDGVVNDQARATVKDFYAKAF